MHQDDLEEKYEFILFFKIVLGKIASAANSSHLTEAKTFVFFVSLSSFYSTYGKLPSPKDQGSKFLS